MCPDDATVSQGDGTSTFYNYFSSYTMNFFLSPANAKASDPDACYTAAGSETSFKWNGSPYSAESNLPYSGSKRPGISQAAIVAPSNTDLLFEGITENDQSTPANARYTGRSPRDGGWTSVKGFWGHGCGC